MLAACSWQTRVLLLVGRSGSLRTFASRRQTGVPVSKNAPLSNLLADYSKYHWDDSITDDDPLALKLRDGILAGSRASLASGITLVESKNPTKRAQGNILLKHILEEERKRHVEHGRDSMIFRIGISGSPGVGKSTFIEALGKELTEERDMKVAVLTIDPTSAVTGGSVLGDLTRMQELSRNPKAYIRQSPTSGSLGGVTRGIHEAIVLCEGAGFDAVIVETVGVGQSEVTVAEMTDLFCLLLSPAHGDELQGVKRGIMELSDLLIVTKDDGDLRSKAKMTQAEYISALKYMRPRTEAWQPKVLRSSIYDAPSISAVCDAMFDFWKTVGDSGELDKRRQKQLQQWMWSHVKDEILTVFARHPKIAAMVLRSSIYDAPSISAVCDAMFDFWKTVGDSGELDKRRQKQLQQWMWSHVKDEILTVFARHPKIAAMVPKLESEVKQGTISPGQAAELMIRCFFGVD